MSHLAGTSLLGRVKRGSNPVGSCAMRALLCKPHKAMFVILILTCSIIITLCRGQAPDYTRHHHILRQINVRDDIAQICETLGFSVGVELGVQNGYFAANNLKKWSSCSKYMLVDIWASQDNYVDIANKPNSEQETIYQDAVSNLKQFGSKAVFMRNFTTDAAKLVADYSVDFVYIDARHDYCGCTEDIQAWWPKLKLGGIMAGHDYVTAAQVWKFSSGHQDWSKCGDGTVNTGAVKGAVDDYVKGHDIKLFTTLRDGPYFSWIFAPKHRNHTIAELAQSVQHFRHTLF